MDKLLSYAKHVAEKVDAEIRSIVSGEPRELYEAGLHYIKAGGKRVRPLITVLASRIAGGSEDIALPGAAAVEIFHTFTLIHDDIIDRSDTRRGVPAVHRVWGEDVAIVVGDLLFALAYKALLRAVDLGVPKDRVLESIRWLTWAGIEVAEGQMLDMVYTIPRAGRVLDLEGYLVMVKKKTASLLMASAAIGAILGGGDSSLIDKLVYAMQNAGIAFQMRDDVLDIVGLQRELGKPIYGDLREGKSNLVVVIAMTKCSELKPKLLKVLGRKDASVEELKEIADCLIQCGAVEEANRMALDYASKAIEILKTIDAKDSEALDMLIDLVKYFAYRER